MYFSTSLELTHFPSKMSMHDPEYSVQTPNTEPKLDKSCRAAELGVISQWVSSRSSPFTLQPFYLMLYQKIHIYLYQLMEF